MRDFGPHLSLAMDGQAGGARVLDADGPGGAVGVTLHPGVCVADPIQAVYLQLIHSTLRLLTGFQGSMLATGSLEIENVMHHALLSFLSCN